MAFLGRSTGWPSLLVVSVCVVGAGLLGSAWFYDDQAGVPADLRSSGVDEIGRNPASVIFLLPVVWLVLAAAAFSRRWPRTGAPADARA